MSSASIQEQSPGQDSIENFVLDQIQIHNYHNIQRQFELNFEKLLDADKEYMQEEKLSLSSKIELKLS